MNTAGSEARGANKCYPGSEARGANQNDSVLRTENLGKEFVLHLQDSLHIPVLAHIDLELHAGECVALTGPSGAGKSTLMRSLYGNYRANTGKILIRHGEDMVDIASADPRAIIAVRRQTIGYVSQFLRVVPRVSALNVVAEAGIARGKTADMARTNAAAMLSRLNIPTRLHALAPATFSGGEQQRINLARGFIGGHPILLLDEPTASLDPANRDVVVAMIREAKSRGVAIIGIFHDTEVRNAVADRLFTVSPLQEAA